MYRFAHISDLHLASMAPLTWRGFFSKRILGHLSWHRNRKYHHLAAVTDALREDLKAQRLNHICITGDLTNLGTAHEIAHATEWLHSLGPNETVSVIPGNHDVYMPESEALMMEAWRPWMGNAFPYAHRKDDVVFIGVSTATATAPFLASGHVGTTQLARLETLLREHTDAFRVVLIHHPPQAGATSRRKGLDDAASFRAVLEKAGAELVLHGHTHKPIATSLTGPNGPIPLLGAGSASYNQHGHYHIVSLQPAPDGTYGIGVEHRRYDAETNRFVAVEAG